MYTYEEKKHFVLKSKMYLFGSSDQKKLIKSTVNLPSRDLQVFGVTVQSKMLVCVLVDMELEPSLYPIKKMPIKIIKINVKFLCLSINH